MPAGRPPGAPNKKKGKRPIEDQDAELPPTTESPSTRTTRAKASSAAPQPATQTSKDKPKTRSAPPTKQKGGKKNTRPAVQVAAAVVQVPDSSQHHSDHTYEDADEPDDTEDPDEEYSSETDLQVTREQVTFPCLLVFRLFSILIVSRR